MSILGICFCCCCIILSRGTDCCKRDNGSMHMLFDHLFNRGYNASVVPITSAEPIRVKISCIIFTLNQVNEKQQTVELLGYLTLQWFDDFLTWNETEFEDVATVVVSTDMVWMPSLIFIESTTYKPAETNGEIRVDSDGELTFLPHSIVQMKCDFDLTYYPFDSHDCRFHIELWSNTADEVTFVSNKFSHRSEIKSKTHTEWDLLIHGANNYTKNYDGLSFSGCRFSMTLKRKPLLQIFNVILPMLLLSVISLSVYRIPIGGGGRVTYGTTILLAFTVWQLMLNDIMPSGTDKISILGIYIVIFEFLSGIALCFSVIVIQMSKRPLDLHIPARIVSVTLFWKNLWKNKQQHSTGKNDVSWKTVAHLVDDVCFYLLLAFVLISTTSMLFLLLSQ